MTKFLSFVLVAFADFFFALPLFGIIAPWDYDVSGHTWAEYHKAVDFYMGARMPIIAQSCLVCMALFLILERKNWREKPFMFMALAILIQILLIVIAINTNVPMNPIMNQWNPENLPKNWATMRDKWLGYHHFNGIFNMSFATLSLLTHTFSLTFFKRMPPELTGLIVNVKSLLGSNWLPLEVMFEIVIMVYFFKYSIVAVLISDNVIAINLIFRSFQIAGL